MTDEFDQQLRDTFAERADQAPVVDLAQGSMKQAGGIRRRRRIGSAVAVLAVAAVAVPLGGQFIDTDTPDTTASKPVDNVPAPYAPVDVAIDGLAQGPEPSVPYVEGPEFHAVSGPNPVLGVNSPAIDAIQVADGAVAWTLDPATGRTAYAATNESLDLPQGKSVTSPTVSLDTNEAAWSVTGSDEGDGKSDIFVLADTDAGTLETVPVSADEIRQVMGVHDGTVIYNGGTGQQRFVGQSDASTIGSTVLSPWESATNVTAVSSDLTRMAGQTEDMQGSDRNCAAMFNASIKQEEWRSCEWIPMEFSSDGSLVLALRSGSDGLGPRELAVLEADDGVVLRTLTTEGTFGRATFEGNESVDSVVAIGDQAAIVRCSIEAGDCELATQPAEVVADDPGSLVYPYQLTAN